MKKRIGDILMEMGFIDQDQLKMALMETKKTGTMLGDVLLRLDWVTEEDLQMAIAVQSGATMTFTNWTSCLTVSNATVEQAARQPRAVRSPDRI